MRALIVTLSALVLGCATTPPPNGAELGAAVRAGRVNLETYDFAAAGYWSMSGAARAAWSDGYEHAAHPHGAVQSCAPEDIRADMASGWVLLAAEAPDEATWRANANAVRAQLAALDQKIAAAQPEVSDPHLHELMLRVARDQAVRNGVGAATLPATLQPSFLWNAISSSRMIAIDCDNTAWLDRQLVQIGWFDIPSFGADADTAAWLLVQHADRAPEFQHRVLTLLQALPSGSTKRSNIGYLADRIATAEGHPQLYGTQGSCDADHSWQPRSIDDPAHLDERRAAIGLPPEAAYLALMAQMNVCANVPALLH
ncbi:MAG: DUF6624 domain-containing protein [Alphaproteobacteria bacterium]